MKTKWALVLLLALSGCHGMEKGHGLDKLLNGGETGPDNPPAQKVRIIPTQPIIRGK